MVTPFNIATRGITLFDYQEAFLDIWRAQDAPRRACLYYRTGGGKTMTALAAMYMTHPTKDDFTDSPLLVVAPPSTHESWTKTAGMFDIAVEVISHAKFRQKTFVIPRDMDIIVDEFHLLGGAKGQGFKKIKQIARGSRGDIIICSATPNYNDAERVYCVMSVIDPKMVVGGYVQFLMTNCVTRVNPFSATPLVDRFREFDDAEEFLALHPNVHFVPELYTAEIQDIELPSTQVEWFNKYGLLKDSIWLGGRDAPMLCTSTMLRSHIQRRMNTFDKNGLRQEIIDQLTILVENAPSKILIYSTSTIILNALENYLLLQKANYSLINGVMSTNKKTRELQAFLTDPDVFFLIGTAAMATGTDGIDKVADTLIILDDTPDDSARKQLIGRILPRGTASDASKKQVYRFVFI